MNDLKMRGAVRIERVGGSYEVSAPGIEPVSAAPGAVDALVRRVAAEHRELASRSQVVLTPEDEP